MNTMDCWLSIFADVMAIRFYVEDVRFTWKNKRKLAQWIRDAIEREERNPGNISVILCSDDYLLGINQQFLEHDFYTDIVTFDYSVENLISGDLYISLDRVVDNSKSNEISTDYELFRVVIHGIMHLCGYKDKSEDEEKLMREKEDFFLKKLKDFDIRLFHVERL